MSVSFCIASRSASTSPEDRGVRAYTRRSNTLELMFQMNENEQEQTVALNGTWQDGFTGEACSAVTLGPVDVRVLRKVI